MNLRKEIQHIYLVGAKSLGAYGGYETFVYKLTEYHQNKENIKYHVACKANGDGCMDENKFEGVTKINDHEFELHNGDQIIYNPEILAPEFERSGYNSVWTDGETDEWLQTVENGIVTACSRTGGKGGWQLYSISRWTAEDGKKLKRHLEIEFEQKKNRQIYWDDVAMFCYPEEYQLGIRPMNRDDIIEVDNLSELIALDASYKKYVEEK